MEVGYHIDRVGHNQTRRPMDVGVRIIHLSLFENGFKVEHVAIDLELKVISLINWTLNIYFVFLSIKYGVDCLTRTIHEVGFNSSPFNL